MLVRGDDTLRGTPHHMDGRDPHLEYELRFGGKTRQIITLAGDHLRRRVEHGPGKAVDVPIAQLIGFTVHCHRFGRRRPRGPLLATSPRLPAFDAQTPGSRAGGGPPQKAAWACHSQAPELHRLLDALATPRPELDLRHLAPDDARRRLGMWTSTQQALAFIAGVFVFLGVLVGLLALTR